jgi:hypothetical protein
MLTDIALALAATALVEGWDSGHSGYRSLLESTLPFAELLAAQLQETCPRRRPLPVVPATGCLRESARACIDLVSWVLDEDWVFVGSDLIPDVEDIAASCRLDIERSVAMSLSFWCAYAASQIRDTLRLRELIASVLVPAMHELQRSQGCPTR